MNLQSTGGWVIGVWTEGVTIYLSKDGKPETWETYEAALAVANEVEKEAPESFFTCERNSLLSTPRFSC